MKAPARDPTSDALYSGTMALHQPARGEGYRVNVDAVLLAWFAGKERRANRAIDLGSGVGAVGLSLLYRDRAEHVLFVEQASLLARLCSENLEANGWTARGEACCADVSNDGARLAEARADLVVCNPPYVPIGRGRPPLVATTARMGELSVFTTAARRALGRRGRACFVYPAGELVTLLATLRASGLEAKRMCLVHSSEGAPARVVLLEAMPAKPGGLLVMPPFVERDEHGPSAAMTAVLAPALASAPSKPFTGKRAYV